MKKNEKNNTLLGAWNWMFSDREHEDGETFDSHFMFNRFTGEVKMLITKRIEKVDDTKERIVRS